MITDITSHEQFEETVNNNDTFMVVLYTAPSWCAPCRRFEPEFEALSELTRVPLVRVDIDRADWQADIQHVPTMLLYHKDGVVNTLPTSKAESLARTLSLLPWR